MDFPELVHELLPQRVHNFSISLDGFAAGPRQSPENPLGEGGLQLHEWIFQVGSTQAQRGHDGAEPGANDDLRTRTIGVGATIMGRNMFGLIRGPWPDESWRGWWGEGERLFEHLPAGMADYSCSGLTCAAGVAYARITRTPPAASK